MVTTWMTIVAAVSGYMAVVGTRDQVCVGVETGAGVEIGAGMAVSDSKVVIGSVVV